VVKLFCNESIYFNVFYYYLLFPKILISFPYVYVVLCVSCIGYHVFLLLGSGCSPTVVLTTV
jgi:hypothetical protein